MQYRSAQYRQGSSEPRSGSPCSREACASGALSRGKAVHVAVQRRVPRNTARRSLSRGQVVQIEGQGIKYACNTLIVCRNRHIHIYSIATQMDCDLSSRLLVFTFTSVYVY